MKSKAAIRRATYEDAELLAALGAETFYDAFANHPAMPADGLRAYLKNTFSVANLCDELADPDAFFLLVEIDREPAGYAKLETAGCEFVVTARNPIKLKRLYIRQRFIGSGVGAVLMKRCLEEVRDRNHDVIWLIVWEHNLRAQNFYRRWNFEQRGVITIRYGNAVFLDALMQRRVEL